MASCHQPEPSASTPEEQATLQNQLLGNHVKLNVGGSPFFTTVKTLNKYDSMLKSMFSGRYSTKTDSKGWILIDRSGKHFEKILNFLRDGSIPLPETKIELEELLVEAKFYQIKELIDEIEQKISNFSHSLSANIFNRVIVSSHEYPIMVKKFSKRLSKPSVQLIMNLDLKYAPGNSESFEKAQLKNLQLFDKLSTDFAGKVLFFRSEGHSCKWRFFGDGQEPFQELRSTGVDYCRGMIIIVKFFRNFH
ncbi:BTB/POZ domain-containing adapter for CUL3-mediated RhoA degradation protein 3-like [Brevipalpus obovatus]|uniref:BTB/POZ domain-containing adapter for CUL3-mediated RhoA degradation protein 3-like n=1 Tax=Brevipalpus obovatus TaxID=246614 RepID=UPI003D9E6758